MLAEHAELESKRACLEEKYDAPFRVVFEAIAELMEQPAPDSYASHRIGGHEKTIDDMLKRTDITTIFPAVRWVLTVASLGLAVWLTGCTQVPQAPVAQVPAKLDAGQLTELVVRAVPMGAALQVFIDKDPNWPFKEKASGVEASQLQCVRQRLSPAGFQESRMQTVNAFIKRYPDQVQDAIDVLGQGGADIIAAIFMAGVERNRTGRDIETKDILGRFTPKQTSKFMDLSLNGKYKPLRELLIGSDDFFSRKSSGTNSGKLFGSQLMLEAMDHCHVPMSVILQNVRRRIDA
jgi:hypothetical protein